MCLPSTLFTNGCSREHQEEVWVQARALSFCVHTILCSRFVYFPFAVSLPIPFPSAVLGGETSPSFIKFQTLCCRAFNVLRQHEHLLVSLFSLMLSAGIPQLTQPDDILWVRERLDPTVSDAEVSNLFIDLIEEAKNSTATQVNELAHLVAHR